MGFKALESGFEALESDFEAGQDSFGCFCDCSRRDLPRGQTHDVGLAGPSGSGETQRGSLQTPVLMRFMRPARQNLARKTVALA
jgi:hypothetical protein